MNLQGSRALWSALLLALAGFLPGCATNGPDPLESWNRPIFAFNEGFDKYVFEPAATVNTGNLTNDERTLTELERL